MEILKTVKANPTETKKRFVAVFDIMGFKDYIYRNDHDAVKERMSLLSKIIRECKKKAKARGFGEDSKRPIETVIFSDTIIIYTSDDSKDSAHIFFFICTIFIANSLSSKIPMKGAISYGVMEADKDNSLYFGLPIVDAHLLADSLHIYGGILDNNVEKKLKEKDYESVLYTYTTLKKAPTKNGKIKHYTLNWSHYLLLIKKISESIKKGKDSDIIDGNLYKLPEEQIYNEDRELATNIINEFYLDMSGTPRLYLDNTIDHINAEDEDKSKKKI